MPTKQEEDLRDEALKTCGNLNLPLPRLQLTWVDTGKDEHGLHTSLCFYSLLIPCGVYDGRNFNEFNKDAPGFCAFHSGATRCKGGKSNYLDTPFRDGTHAKWDKKTLKLPVYVVNGDKYKLLE